MTQTKNTNTTDAVAMQAELDAMRAELEALRAQGVKPATAREVWRTPHVATEGDTLLAQASRLSRHVLIVSSFKAIRAAKWSDLPAILVMLTERVTTEGSPNGTTDKAFAKFVSDKE